MKRGINSELSTATNDILSLIFNYIPKGLFYANDSIATVCNQWNEIIHNDKALLLKKPFKKLIQDCLNNPEDVLFILRNAFMYTHFNPMQILEICGCHEDLAARLLKNEAFCNIATGNMLATLGQHYTSLYRAIVGNPLFFPKLSTRNIITLAKNHEYLVNLIMREKNPLRPFRMEGKNAAYLCQNHLSSVIYLLEVMHQHTKPNAAILAILAQKYSEIVTSYILHKFLMRKDFFFIFTENDLKTLANIHPQIALALLRDRHTHLVFLQLIEGLDTSLLSMDHAQLTEALRTETTLQKLNGNDLEFLAISRPDIVLFILKNETLYNKLSFRNVVHIAVHSFEAAKYLLSDLSNSRIFAKMLKNENYLSLNKIFSQYPEMAKSILRNKEHNHSLKGFSLLQFAENFPEEIGYIIQHGLYKNDDLLPEEFVRIIVDNHLYHAAKMIIEDKTLKYEFKEDITSLAFENLCKVAQSQDTMSIIALEIEDLDAQNTVEYYLTI